MSDLRSLLNIPLETEQLAVATQVSSALDRLRPASLAMLTHDERMERWRERNQEAEFYVWCGVGLLVALMVFGAFRR